MTSAPWVLATRNAGKLRELHALFASHSIDVVSLADIGVAKDAVAEDDIESFATFEENALAKARYFSSLLPGRIVVADDSGLSVDALEGAPGVYSKRWSGCDDETPGAVDRANNTKLIACLRGESRRGARFVCAAAWCDGRQEIVARGEVMGRIVDEARGAHGFGYDPHFFVNELGMSLAEATVMEKQRVSHRARAFERLFSEVHTRGVSSS